MDKPSGWVKHLTQLLVENTPVAGFVHILLSAGLYWTQHFIECKLPSVSLFSCCFHTCWNKWLKSVLLYIINQSYCEEGDLLRTVEAIHTAYSYTLKHAGLFFSPKCWVQRRFFYLNAGLSLSLMKLLYNAAVESTGSTQSTQRQYQFGDSFGEIKVCIHFIYKVFNVV